MPLNWNIEKVKDYKTLCWDESKSMKLKTDSLIWLMIAIDMTRITSKNWKEVYRRVWLVEAIRGVSCYKAPEGKTHPDEGEDWIPDPFTPADIKAHIGLGTNVSTMTPFQWNKKFLNTMVQNEVDRETSCVE